MPYKDENERREYQRKYKRKQREGESQDKKRQTEKIRIKTISDIQYILSKCINEVWNSDTELLVKVRTIGYLSGHCMKAIETGDIESRLQEIEKELEKIKK